ncbi:MAG: Peptidase [Acidobacteria bacterium]|nr:Peptidase [Acidobacteriota bacterium]
MRKLTLLLLAALIAFPLLADEGMWLFNRPPRQALRQKYNFEPTQAWLDHLQKSSIRFNSGGSGSFLSKDGLALTNHHVGLDCLQKISTEKKDYIRDGYYAKTRADEVKCVDLELNVLMSIEDVTARVNGAVTPEMSAADAQRARRSVMAAIEQESTKSTGLRSDVVTLYQGGEYHLYRYKKYTDVRLVFAPEVSIASFGGDPDNFEYPRYDLDVAFFRAYENDKPAKIDNYLKWSAEGAKDGELVFVSGHPGGTHRLNTVTHLEFFRDLAFSYTLELLRRREVLYSNYAERSAENARRANEELRGWENSRKAYGGMEAGLQDPQIVAAKRAAEQKLRDAIANDPKMAAAYADAWPAVEKALDVYRPILRERSVTNFNSTLFADARDIVRLADELQKPSGERLREFRDSNLESVKQALLADAPVYADLETVKLSDALAHWVEVVGADNPLVRQVLGNQSPQSLAAELVRGTKIGDAKFRQQLVEGGKAAVDASNDPMIRFARQVDPRTREIRTLYEQQVDEPLRQAYAKIAKAGFAVSGGETYPDATFTLRLSYGAVKGYEENGKQIPWATVYSGAFARAAEHGNKTPFDLPKSWLAKKPVVDMKTPFNFVSTVDIIGGNSGSPVVNRAGEFVGIVFDGNLQSLSWDYQFDDRQGRGVSVHARGIMEALKKVYAATPLVNELTK